MFLTELSGGWEPISHHEWFSQRRFTILVPLAALAAGCVFVTSPEAIVLLTAALLAIPLLVSSKVRVVYLVVGTVTVFGPAELTTSKLLFLVGVALALVGAFSHCRTLVNTAAYSDLKPLLHASAAFLLVIVLSFPVAHLNQVPSKDWLRDIAPYVLLAWVPLFALDAQSGFGVRGLRRLIVVVGLASAVAFTVNWYGRRGLASGFTHEYGLATLLLSAALFSFAFAVVLDSDKGRLRWFALGTLVFAMLATTGTRSAAVLLVAPLAILFGTRDRLARRSFRLILALPIAAILVFLGAQSLLGVVDANPQIVATRLQALSETGTGSDDSYVNRRNEMESAWHLFKDAPLFGVGPGHPIPWMSADGSTQANTFVDVSVGFLPDYGVAGLLAVAFMVVSFASVVRRLRLRSRTRTTSQLALIGLAAVIAAYTPLQVPFEDKGLSVGLLLLLAYAVREASDVSKSHSVTDASATGVRF